MSAIRPIGRLSLIVVLTLITGILCVSAVMADEPGVPPGEKPPADVFSRVKDAGTADDHKGADHNSHHSQKMLFHGILLVAHTLRFTAFAVNLNG